MLAVIDYRGVKSEGLMRFAKIMQQKTVIAHSAATDIRLLGHVTGVGRLLCLPRSRMQNAPVRIWFVSPRERKRRGGWGDHAVCMLVYGCGQGRIGR
jgi:hypothetical protein